MLEHLQAEDSLHGVGYGDLDDEGAEDPPPVAVARLGELWHLGERRLHCGDSTNLKDVLRVMDGDRAPLVATDPPYVVDYTGEPPNDSGKDWTDSCRGIDIEDADGFFCAAAWAPHAPRFRSGSRH